MPSGPFYVVSTWRLGEGRRHRPTCFGKMVLQVEEVRDRGTINYGNKPNWTSTESRWRDATWEDMANG